MKLIIYFSINQEIIYTDRYRLCILYHIWTLRYNIEEIVYYKLDLICEYRLSINGLENYINLTLIAVKNKIMIKI